MVNSSKYPSRENGNHSANDYLVQDSQITPNQEHFTEQIGLNKVNLVQNAQNEITEWSDYKKQLIQNLKDSSLSNGLVKRIEIKINGNSAFRNCPFSTIGTVSQGAMMTAADFAAKVLNKIAAASYRNNGIQPFWRQISKADDKKQFFYEYSFNGKEWFLVTPNSPEDLVPSPLK